MPTSLDEQLLLLQARVEALAKGVSEKLTADLASMLETAQGRVLLLAEKTQETPSLVRKKKYMDAQLAEINKVYDEAYAVLDKRASKEIPEIAKGLPEVVHEAHRRALPASIIAKISVPKLTTNRVVSWFEAFEVDGLRWQDWIKGAKDTVKKETVKAAKEALVFGESKKVAARRLNVKIEVGVKRSQRLVQDAVHGAHSYAEKVYHEQNAALINRYRFSAEMDGRTCPRCQDLDGTKSKNRGDLPDPPIHTLCRCRISTVWVGQEFLGDKPSRFAERDGWTQHRDGTRSAKWKPRGAESVPRDLKYKDWVQGLATSKNPAKIATAKEILGKTRFNLVRDGKLSVDKLYHNGQFVTIKDLKRKYNL